MRDLEKLPKRINPDFLASTTVEIRFSSDLPQDQIVGSIITNLQPMYPQLEVIQKPINLMPLGNQAVNVPDIYLKNGELQIGVGKNVVTISCIDVYIGWVCFSARIHDVCSQLASISGLITNATRLGLRFVNYFANRDNIDEMFDLNVVFPEGDTFQRTVFTLREELHKDKYGVILNIANKSYFIKSSPFMPSVLPTSQPTGTALDIDVYLLPAQGVEPLEIEKEIAELHRVEKRMFYSLLRDAFVAECKPEY